MNQDRVTRDTSDRRDSKWIKGARPRAREETKGKEMSFQYPG